MDKQKISASWKLQAWIKFAAHALGCLLVDRTISPEDASERAAEYADSMIEQLKKRVAQ